MKDSGWLQTIIMVLTVVAACVSGALWIQSENQALYSLIMENEREQDLFNRTILTRLTSGGWSFAKQLDFVEGLRDAADHPVPGVTPLSFDFDRGTR